ncbi:MAG: ABC transporter substrate-binding protein [Ruminococcus sp.]|jgi:oligopeptide transport system substrate-binding protein|nr:ABC transporter substrate-binding protein [Ruminococcus sp.]
MKSRISALFLAVLMIFTLSACRENSSGGSSLFEMNLAENPYNLDPQLATDPASREIIKNTYRMLIKQNGDGTLTPDACSDYVLSEDGLRYTFTIKDNIFWQSKSGFEAPLTSNDFVFAFQRIFNKSSGSPYAEKFICIKGARNIIYANAGYYTLNVVAPDPKTLVFELEYPCWNFLELLSDTAAAPCSEAFFKLTKGRYGLDPESDASCGAFYVSDHNFDPYWNENYIVLSRNEKNSEFDKTLPRSVTYNIKSPSENEDDFKVNDIDFLTSDSFTAVMKNADTKAFLTKTVIIKPGTAFSEEYPELFAALVFTSYSFEPNDSDIPENCIRAHGIIPPAVTMMGKSFRTSVSDTSLRPKKRGSITDQYYGDLRLTVRADAPYADLCFELSDYWREVLGVNIFVESVSDTEYESIKESGYDLLVDELTATENSPVAFLAEAGATSEEINRIKTASSLSFATSFAAESEKTAVGELIPLLFCSEYFASKNGIKGAEYLPFEKFVIMKGAER